ncbi:hypothetical protein [Devosia sp. RR2S18]|uniref:hypothetical protein n=1 Tax=Devosia rhizosphaerae TaxID=3049774 RepID=UPI0025419BF5|nr:hypothetical protein [Devosia sp. RR2S18]WIJ25947.1 hypothetical protein QOV41_04055 [Devosia sp. RR2S18]
MTSKQQDDAKRQTKTGEDRSPAREKDRGRDTTDQQDLPGAEGPRGAGANEDTYD